MFLALLEYTKTGQVEKDDDTYGRSSSLKPRGFHKLSEVDDIEVSLSKVCGLGGEGVAEDIDLDEASLVQYDAFGGDPDDEVSLL